MNDQSLTVAAYAKVNFTLDVLGRRSDGFHGIASVMQTVSLADSVILTVGDGAGITLESDDPVLSTGSDNLAFTAAKSIQQVAGRETRIHIRLLKRIPSQAGLGGGSSDAAAVLRGLNHLLNLGLDTTTLSQLGLTIGSDVPFFLHGGAASCRGRGEIVTPLPDPPLLWFVIVKPDIDVSTSEAYRSLDLIPNRTSARATRAMEVTLRSGDSERVALRMTNDFEQTIYSSCLPIALLHDEMMMARSRNARLCGSGSAVFGVTLSRAEAEETARMMRLKYERVSVCRSVTRDESVAFGDPASDVGRESDVGALEPARIPPAS